MRPEIAVQIVNYKTKSYLPECIEGVIADLNPTQIPYHINILDNASGDDLTDLKEQYADQPVHFYTSDKNGGFGAGQNILASKTNAPYLFILNPDTKLIEPKTIERLYMHLQQNPKVKVTGPQLLTAEGEIQEWDHGELTNKRAQKAMAKGSSYWKIRKRACEVAWVSGAAFFVEKAAFDQVDGFDENFFMYKEEEDLCVRIRQHGGKVIYDPTIQLAHLGNENKKDHFFAPSQAYFIKKHVTKD